MIESLKADHLQLLVIMHSDGAVAPLIEDFIEIGIDIYNPVQPNVPGSDPEELASRYGGRIRFSGASTSRSFCPVVT